MMSRKLMGILWVLAIALGVGVMTGLPSRAETGTNLTPPTVQAPTLETVMDEESETLVLRASGTPNTPFVLRFLFSENAGANWQLLPLVSGNFDANGEWRLTVPLSAFDELGTLDALIDIGVWDNSAGASGFLSSMVWGVVMRRANQLPSRTASVSDLWSTWNVPLPGTVSPTFPVSVGAVYSESGLAIPGEINIFTTGPAEILQAWSPTGIEGMLPVN